MARVVGPLFSAEATGRVSGLVFARGRHGQTVGGSWTRSRWPVRPGRNPRAALKEASQLWSILTPTYRQQWLDRHGNPAAARSAFIRYRTRLQAASVEPGFAALSPATLPPGIRVTSVSYFMGGTQVRVVLNASPGEDFRLILKTKPCSIRRSSISDHQYTTVAVTPGLSPLVSWDCQIRPKTMFVRFELLDTRTGLTVLTHHARLDN
jgi:hypothetical protein